MRLITHIAFMLKIRAHITSASQNGRSWNGIAKPRPCHSANNNLHEPFVGPFQPPPNYHWMAIMIPKIFNSSLIFSSLTSNTNRIVNTLGQQVGLVNGVLIPSVHFSTYLTHDAGACLRWTLAQCQCRGFSLYGFPYTVKYPAGAQLQPAPSKTAGV